MTTDIWFDAAIAGDSIAMAKLEMTADDQEREHSILYQECWSGNLERVRFILREFANKNLLIRLTKSKETVLMAAAFKGHTELVQVLLDAATHFYSSLDQANCDPLYPLSFRAFIRQANVKLNTALHAAIDGGNNVEIVKLLVEADPDDRHIQNSTGKTPIYMAAKKGHIDIVKVMCTTCTNLSLDGPKGSTPLHAAINNFDQDDEGKHRGVVMELVNAAKRWSNSEDSPQNMFEYVLFNRPDKNGKTVLYLAVQENYVEVVELILVEDPDYRQPGSKSNGLQSLIYKAAKYGDNDIVKLLSKAYEAGISPRHSGLMALCLAIQDRDKESVLRMLGDAKHLVACADHDGWTPLHFAAHREFDSILDAIVEAQEEVGFQYVYDKVVSTPFHVAAEKRYTSTVLRLLQLWPSSSSAYTDVNNKGQNILHLAAAQSEKQMIQGILKYCPQKHMAKILNEQDANGDTPLHLLISLGCFIPELIRKHKFIDMTAKNKDYRTPLDMLYVQDEIIADQVQIKNALDDIKVDQSWKFWHRSTKTKWNVSKMVLPNTKGTKDAKFNKAKKILMIEKQKEMKMELDRYKKRTNIQIIVTALITTVTFTVGFTMPGGLQQSGELNQGLVVLSRKPAFSAFMVTDALALLLSTSSLFFNFLESMNEDAKQVSKLNAASTVLNIVSVVAMMLTFITGTYVVLSHSLALAITVCIIGSLFFIFVIVLLIKLVYDRQTESYEE